MNNKNTFMKSIPFKIFLIIFAVVQLCNSFTNSYSQQIKIACIGNSITAGYYPAKLQNLLGDNYLVRNFGVAARTMLLKGDFPYMNEEKYKQSLEFNPDIVIIALGTNDSKPHNWKYGDEFQNDLMTMVVSFQVLPSSPNIFLCRPLPAFEIRYGINDLVLQKEIYPIIKETARKKKCGLIDLYTPFIGMDNLFPDKIHPNEEGAEKMAQIIEKNIRKIKKRF